MLTGRQKTQLLISLLEDESGAVLNLLSPEIATSLTENMEEVPKVEVNDYTQYLDEIIEKIQEKQDTVSEEEIPSDDIDEISDIEDLETEDDTKPPYPDNYRSIEAIVEDLEKQPDQLIAFFLQHAEEPLKTEVQEYLSEEVSDRIEKLTVEPVPISKRIYEKMFERIVIKSDDDKQGPEEEL